MAVYGDTLVYFPEQMRTVEYFSMNAQVGAGYSKREILGKVRGVFQFLKKGELTREGYVLNDTDVPTFWTKTKLIVGNFISFEKEDYRITNNYPWLFQGGFYCYSMESVVGTTDVQKKTDFDYGKGKYT